MIVLHLLGAFLTCLTVALVGMVGYLAALRLRPADDDPLALAIRTLLLATAQAVAVALVLGGLGVLRIELALAAETLLLWLLHRSRRRGSSAEGGAPGTAGLAEPALAVARRTAHHLRRYPALALIAAHAVGTEALRGLLRPPLSWDSLMYHLYLAASWLQQGSLELFPALHPTTAYFFAPADGSLWLWWWMAPSHGEIYVNLAALPHWLLLGLAAGAFARELGARRHWPVAAFLTVLTPAVLRFATTQYVDILLAAMLVTAALHLVRWMRRAAWRDAMLAGTALGLAVGTKVLGLPFAAALAGFAVLAARGEWRRRSAQVAAGLLAVLLLGGFFYARNVALGGGLFGYPCVQPGSGDRGVAGNFPAEHSVAALWNDLAANGQLAGAFLGSNRPTLADIGLGPQALLLLAAALALPFAVRRGARAAAGLAQCQIAAQLVLWVLVPYAANAHVLANVRYLDGAVALAFAGAVAIGERFLADRWLRGVALAAAIQDLLMLHTAMPRGVRWLLAAALLAAVALALSAGVRRTLARRWRPLAAAAALAALAAAPALVTFRIEDRERAFSRELTAHLTSSRVFAPAWGWLDAHGGDGTVAVSMVPENYFVYPAMGPLLERRAIYAHVHREAHSNPLHYPGCRPRIDLDRAGWIENLAREEVRWLHVARFPDLEFPVEDRWARERPDLFRPVFDHPTNRIYLFLGTPAPGG